MRSFPEVQSRGSRQVANHRPVLVRSPLQLLIESYPQDWHNNTMARRIALLGQAGAPGRNDHASSRLRRRARVSMTVLVDVGLSGPGRLAFRPEAGRPCLA